MAIEKQVSFSIEQLSEQLGVSTNALKNFLQETPSPSYQSPKHTALDVIDEYHENLRVLVQMNKRSSETWKTYNNFLIRIKNYITSTSPKLLISEFNEIILNKIIYHNNKGPKKYSPRTLNKYNAIIKSIMTFAFEMNYTEKNLSYKFNIIEETLIPKYINEKDLVKIIKVAELLPKAYRCKAIIIFLLGTGCRVSEVSRIKVRDFDIENGVIYIRNGKGNKDRVIPMFKAIRVEILNYLKKSGMEEWDGNCSGYLFARDEGTERTRNLPIRTIEYLIERIRNKLPELDFITAHTFRHTFAVQCLKIGIESHMLTLILGHSNPKTTMVYTQLYNEDLKELISDKFPFPFENLLTEIITEEEKL